MRDAARGLMVNESFKSTRETDRVSFARRDFQYFAGLGNGRLLPRWVIPMLYTLASVTAGLILPRLEHAYFAGYC